MMTSVSESTSDDLAEFWAAQTRPGARCPIPLLIDSLPPERAASLTKALEQRQIQHAAIVKVLETWGVDVTPDTIGRHRRRICKCPKT